MQQISSPADFVNQSPVVTADLGEDWSSVTTGAWLTRASSGAIYTVASPATYSGITFRWSVSLTAPYAGATENALATIHQDFDADGLPIFAIGDTENQPILNRAFQILRRALRGRAPIYRETRVVPSGGVATLDFTLPTGFNYDDLRLSLIGRGTAVALVSGVRMQFNGDTTGNYAWNVVYADNGDAPLTFFFDSTTQVEIGSIPAASSTVARSGAIQLWVPGFSSAILKKSVIALNTALYGEPNLLANRQYAGFWFSVAPITSVRIVLAAGNFAEGTIVTLELLGATDELIASTAAISKKFSRALPINSTTTQPFVFAVTKPDNTYIPTVLLVNNSADAELEDIRWMVTQKTVNGFNIVLFNAPPTANYTFEVEA